MKISAIVAVARNRVIGKDNDIPWRLSSDLKYFKKVTIGHHIIMGRKSFMSLGRPLPNRTNVVVTRDPFFIASNCLVVHSIPEALAICKDNGEQEAFIIGGGTIYEQTLDIVDTLYITEVDAEPEGDAYFPEIDHDKWSLVSTKPGVRTERDDHDFVFKVYDRKI